RQQGENVEWVLDYAATQKCLLQPIPDWYRDIRERQEQQELHAIDMELVENYFQVRAAILADGDSVEDFDREHRHHCKRLGLPDIWLEIDRRNGTTANANG